MSTYSYDTKSYPIPRHNPYLCIRFKQRNKHIKGRKKVNRFKESGERRNRQPNTLPLLLAFNEKHRTQHLEKQQQ